MEAVVLGAIKTDDRKIPQSGEIIGDGGVTWTK